MGRTNAYQRARAGLLTHGSSPPIAFPGVLPPVAFWSATSHLQWPDRPGFAPGSLLSLSPPWLKRAPGHERYSVN